MLETVISPMIPRGSFVCALCEERLHLNYKKEAYRSFFPERKIPVCEYCYDEWRTSPEYEHLRPDLDPEDKEKIEKVREYYGETHIFF